MLVLTGCMAESPPRQPPTTTGPYTPTVTPATEQPPPPPEEWLEVEVDSGGRRIQSTSGQQVKLFRHWRRATTMYVVFQNVGDEQITSPKIKFELQQREPDPRTGTELATHFTGATGEGWKCTGSLGTRTCTSKATVAPGEAMPTIELGIKTVNDTYTRTHFTAAYGDLLYEAIVFYDTSV